uniref:Uncharacterized protein n=1 Tax=Timema cristinae TaxID=61476 RepID=A0A7R9HD70_TIMCR|nr:unnamed protein product [Timema cristinae]
MSRPLLADNSYDDVNVHVLCVTRRLLKVHVCVCVCVRCESLLTDSCVPDLRISPVLECSKLWVCEAHRIAGEQAANILSAALIWIDGGGENYAKMLLEAVTTAREIGSCGRHVQACQQDAGDKEWLPILASLLDHVV